MAQSRIEAVDIDRKLGGRILLGDRAHAEYFEQLRNRILVAPIPFLRRQLLVVDRVEDLAIRRRFLWELGMAMDLR